MSAFAAVMLLLAMLAAALWLLTLIYPAPVVPPRGALREPQLPEGDLAPYLAAIHAAAVQRWPGARILQLEELLSSPSLASKPPGTGRSLEER